MPISDKYTQRLGLAELDVYLDTPDNDNTYFNIINLPQIAGYGKYSFQVSYNDPDDSELVLKQGSGIIFEIVDANGETIFSELSDIPDASGAASAYFWIKKDPLWLAGEIADGPATLYIVGELDNVPEEYAGTYNVRTAFTFEIRKSQPNTSRILFYDIPALQLSSSITGDTVEFDKGSTTFARGYIEVSASHMETHGGQVNFIELSYLESGSRTDEFTPLTEYPLIGSASRYELSESIDGLNPISHVFRMPVPRDFRRDTQAKFRLRFLDANKSPAKYYDEVKNDQIIEITSSFLEVNGTPFIIEKEDNLLKGSMYTGNAVGKGFEQSGKNSAYLKTVDYTGFKSASLGIGSAGVMFFSGSVLPGSGDDYDGVGLELFGTTESFFRYRSNPSELDIRTNAFFVGSENAQFISASGGQIEISSSNFHLEPSGDVSLAGTIEAADGKIGGFHISESRINSANEKIIFKSSGQISASSLLLASGSFVVDPDNLSRFGSDGFQSFVMAENTGVIIQTSNFNLNTARFIMSSSDVGVLAVGSTPPLDFDNGTGFYVDGDGNFLVGKSTGPRIQFDGFDTIISSSNFFLGSGQQFVSGSNGNVEISSSNFHLDANGNVNMAGTITATAGEIGGFSVSADALSSTNFFISGAASGTELFISSSGFSVDAQGVVSASDLSLQGGDVGGLNVAEGTVSVGEILKLKDSGQITGSQVLFTGGKIASFNLSDDAFSTDSFFISSSATNNDMFISSSNFNVKASGDITGSNVLFTGGKISGSDLKMEVPTFFLGSPSQFISGSNGNIEITSSNFHLDKDGTVKTRGEITATSGKIAGWTISGDTLVGANATLDGAGSALFKSDQGPGSDSSAPFDQLRDEYYIDFTPTQGATDSAGRFYVKFGPNFSIDNSGILFASGAQFEGTVSASKGIIGGFTTDNSAFSDNNGQIFISGSPAVGGTHHPRFMFISSSNFNVKQSGDITGSSALFNGNTSIGGTLNVTGTGTIAGFGLTNTAISSSNDNLILRSDGRITGSEVFFNGGKIGGFIIDSDEIKSTGGTMILDSDTRDGTIALGATPNVNIDGTNAGVYMNGLGDFLVRVDANNFIKVDQDATVKLDMKAETFFLGGTNQFVTGSNGNIAISSSNFHLDTAGNVNMSGTVTATAGKIAGFTISGNSLTATNFEIDASGKRITLGDAASTDLFVADADEGIQLGNNTFGLAPFSVTKAGVLKAVAGTVGGYGISATAISSSNDNLILKNSGQITGSTVLFTGGKIGGFTIDADEIKSTNLLLDSTNEKITVGSANAITIQGGGTDNFIVMGSKSAFAQTSTAGVILGMDNNVPSFDMTRNATNYMRFDTSTGVDIKTDTFKLDTATLDIDSSTSRIQVVNGSSNEVIRFGEISDSASDLYGIKVYDGSGTADSNILVKLGGEGNTIGGWTITNDQIQSDNLIIHSSGRLETADFASGVKGWRISSEGNGEAEFENATIRGTLSTAVFEKETVNAVGGQLYIANSTALTGSGQISASFDTMSVVNVSGFVAGEILSLKKVTETGFTTEYVLVNSASRDDRSSDTNFAGKLMVTRGYGRNTTGDSGSLGGSPATSQSYEPGQVLVSTGKIGTGYIRLNANPNDQATPYMDIVERTGAGIYDIELKTRVGDLSGLSSATLFGNANPGFGIFTENGFFKGGINATTGSFTGVVHINTSASEIMKLGTNVDSTNDGIHINNNNYWYTDSQFKVGDANSFILHDGAGDIKIVSENFTLKGGSKLLMTTQSLAFDTSNASTATRTAGTGIFMSSSGDFRVGNASGNRLTFSGTSLELVTSDLNIDTSTFDLSTDGTGKIALGATPPTDISSGTGFFVDGAGNFLAGNASGNFIRFNQSSGAVQVAGEITIAAGSTSEVDFGAGAAASASVASASAAAAAVSASEAQASASVAQSLATGAVASASEASSSAVTATAAASTAQSAIDDMETQVVLNSSGMDLRNESNLNLVSYGTTTKFFDGVGDDDGNMKLRLNTDGVFAFANHTSSFARFYNEGVQLVSGSVEFAKFAGVTTIGNTSTEHVRITDSGLELKDGSTVRLSMNSSGMQIGSVSDGITLDASGNATFNGAITISPSDLPAGTVSGSSQVSDITGSLSSSLAPYETQVVLDSAGMSLKSLAGNTLASYGTTVTIGENADDKSRIFIDNNSVDLIVDSGGTDTTFASFGATTTVGNTSAEHVSIDSDSVDIIQDANNKAVVNASGLTITQGGNNVATFGSTARLGQTSAEHVLVDSTGLTIKDSSTVVGKFNSNGATIGKTAGGHISASTTAVHIKRDDDNFSKMDADSFDIVLNGKTSASFGAVTTIGSTEASHTLIDSGSFRLKDGNNVRLQMDAKGIRMGNQFTVDSSGDATFSGALTIGTALANSISGSVGDVSASLASDVNAASSSAGQGISTANAAQADATAMATQVVLDSDGMSLKNQAANLTLANFGTTVTVGQSTGTNQNVHIDSDSVDIRRGTQVTASFGATTTIGPVSSAHTFIDSGSLRLKDGSTERLIMDAKGIRMGNQFSVAADGTATFGGTLTVGNLVSSSAQLADAISGSSGEFSASAASSIAGTLSDSASMASAVQLTSEGLNVLNSSGDKLSEFGTNVFVGLQNAEHVKISSAGLELKDNTTVVGKFNANGATIGKTAGAHISASTFDVHIIKDSDNKAVLDSDSFDIILNGATSASFGATTTIGSAIGQHVKITNDAFEIKTDANTTVLSASSAGLEMSGDINAAGGTIGGFAIDSTTLSSTTTQGFLQLKQAVNKATAGITTGPTFITSPDEGRFIARYNGQITGSLVSFTGGKVGGWTLSDTTLTGGVVTLNSAGSIEVGSLADATTTATTNSGFFADSSGNVLIKGNVSDNSYLKVSAGGGIDIRSDEFFLGSADTSFISGSNSTVAISSSNFHLGTDGDLALAGNIETGKTGQRVELNAASNQLFFYNSSGEQIFKIGSQIFGSLGGGPVPDGLVNLGGNQTSKMYLFNRTDVSYSYKYFPVATFQNIVSGSVSDGDIDKDIVGIVAEVKSLRGSGTIAHSGADTTTTKHLTGLDGNVAILGDTSGGDYSVAARANGVVGRILYGGVRSNSGDLAIGAGGDADVTLTNSTIHAGIRGQVQIDTGTTVNQTSGFYYSGYFTGAPLMVDIAGSSTAPAIQIQSADDGFYHDGGIKVMVNNAIDFFFQDGGDFHADGDLIAFSTTISDKRVKKDVITIGSPIDKIKKLRGVEYTWSKGKRKDQKDIGVIAQEVEKVLPQIVREKDVPLWEEKDEEIKGKYKTVDYEKLTALLIEGMKEQQKQIDELKEEIKELKDGSS